MYSDSETEAWFKEAWRKAGKKLDMGKSCVRFKRIEDLPLDLIARTIRRTPVSRFLSLYERARKH